MMTALRIGLVLAILTWAVVVMAAMARAASPEVVGHRGTAYRPENTLAGISNADYHRADRVEVDVRETATGTLVAMHDETLEATTDGTGAVAERSHRYIRSLRVYTRHPEKRPRSATFDGRFRVPSLAAVVNRANKRGIALLLDVKTGARNPRLLTQVRAATVDVDLQVRDMGDLRYLKARTGSAVGWCCTWPSDALLEALSDEGAAHVSVKGSTITADRVLAAHEYGLDVHAWGWSAAKLRDQLTSWGVDSLHLDRP